MVIIYRWYLHLDLDILTPINDLVDPVQMVSNSLKPMRFTIFTQSLVDPGRYANNLPAPSIIQLEWTTRVPATDTLPKSEFNCMQIVESDALSLTPKKDGHRQDSAEKQGVGEKKKGG